MLIMNPRNYLVLLIATSLIGCSSASNDSQFNSRDIWAGFAGGANVKPAAPTFETADFRGTWTFVISGTSYDVEYAADGTRIVGGTPVPATLSIDSAGAVWGNAGVNGGRGALTWARAYAFTGQMSATKDALSGTYTNRYITTSGSSTDTGTWSAVKTGPGSPPGSGGAGSTGEVTPSGGTAAETEPNGFGGDGFGGDNGASAGGASDGGATDGGAGGVGASISNGGTSATGDAGGSSGMDRGGNGTTTTAFAGNRSNDNAAGRGAYAGGGNAGSANFAGDSAGRSAAAGQSTATAGTAGTAGAAGCLGASTIDPVIEVTLASFGETCGDATGNVTAVVAERCNGVADCSLTVSNNNLGGDPFYGCPKSLVVHWRCSPCAPEQTSSTVSEGGTLDLRCHD